MENGGKKDILYQNNRPGKQVSQPEGSVSVIITPFAVLKGLLVVVAVLLSANLVFIYFSQLMENTVFTWYLNYFFNFNGEHNIPAFFSSVILMTASLLLFFIYQNKHSGYKPADKKYWLILSIVFLFLAIDENVEIHEQLNSIIRPMLANDLSGFLYWAWVIPYFVAFVLIAIYFMAFVLRLPPFTRSLFFIAGFLFVFGAVGLELVEGYVYTHYSLEHIYNKLLYCLEEFLEMTGIVLFIYALLDYMARANTRLLIQRKRNSAAAVNRPAADRNGAHKKSRGRRFPAEDG